MRAHRPRAGAGAGGARRRGRRGDDEPLRARVLLRDADARRGPADPRRPGPHGAVRRASPGYFATMRIPLRRGRDFADSDGVEQPCVVIVSQLLADRHWPGVDPLGRGIRRGTNPRPCTVVGVVGDVSDVGFGQPPAPTVYVSYTQNNVAVNPVSLVPHHAAPGARRDRPGPGGAGHLRRDGPIGRGTPPRARGADVAQHGSGPGLVGAAGGHRAGADRHGGAAGEAGPRRRAHRGDPRGVIRARPAHPIIAAAAAPAPPARHRRSSPACRRSGAHRDWPTAAVRRAAAAARSHRASRRRRACPPS